MVEVSQVPPHRYHNTANPPHPPISSLRPRRPLPPASRSPQPRGIIRSLLAFGSCLPPKDVDRRERSKEPVRDRQGHDEPRKRRHPTTPVSSAVPFFPRTRASYKTHKKRETYHFDTVPLRPNQSFCNIDRGSEKLAQLPLPASRQPSTTPRAGLSPPGSRPQR